jgi:hypothetical protein
MMKIYEVLTWSSATAFDEAFFFQIEASNLADAKKKVAELVTSQEWVRKKLLVERIEEQAERLARCA